MKRWRCTICDHIYDPADGEPRHWRTTGDVFRESARELGMPRLRSDQARLRGDGELSGQTRA
jgi:rubredoxin